MNCIGPSEPFKITVEKDIPHCVIRDGKLAERGFSPRRHFGVMSCVLGLTFWQIEKFAEMTFRKNDATHNTQYLSCYIFCICGKGIFPEKAFRNHILEE